MDKTKIIQEKYLIFKKWFYLFFYIICNKSKSLNKEMNDSTNKKKTKFMFNYDTESLHS